MLCETCKFAQTIVGVGFRCLESSNPQSPFSKSNCHVWPLGSLHSCPAWGLGRDKSQIVLNGRTDADQLGEELPWEGEEKSGKKMRVKFSFWSKETEEKMARMVSDAVDKVCRDMMTSKASEAPPSEEDGEKAEPDTDSEWDSLEKIPEDTFEEGEEKPAGSKTPEPSEEDGDSESDLSRRKFYGEWIDGPLRGSGYNLEKKSLDTRSIVDQSFRAAWKARGDDACVRAMDKVEEIKEAEDEKKSKAEHSGHDAQRAHDARKQWLDTNINYLEIDPLQRSGLCEGFFAGWKARGEYE